MTLVKALHTCFDSAYLFARWGLSNTFPPPPSLDSSPAPKHNMCSIYSGLLLVTRRGVYAYSHAELKNHTSTYTGIPSRQGGVAVNGKGE